MGPIDGRIILLAHCITPLRVKTDLSSPEDIMVRYKWCSFETKAHKIPILQPLQYCIHAVRGCIPTRHVSQITDPGLCNKEWTTNWIFVIHWGGPQFCGRSFQTTEIGPRDFGQGTHKFSWGYVHLSPKCSHAPTWSLIANLSKKKVSHTSLCSSVSHTLECYTCSKNG